MTKFYGLLHRFVKAKGSAIALTMAITLVPLVLLIGVAVDVTFLSQERLQTAYASQAAAATAVRVAAATYAQEVAVNGPGGGSGANEDSQVSAEQATNSADVVGDLWFRANLGNYSLGTLKSDNVVATYDGNIYGNQNSTVPPNFTAQVSASSAYPPIFNPLFGHPASQPWVYATSGTATTQFAYAQILFMLDTSQSMMIGATTQDVQKLEENAVCPPDGSVLPGAVGSTDKLEYNNTPPQDNDYNYAPGDGTWIGFGAGDVPGALNYSDQPANGSPAGTEPNRNAPSTANSGIPNGTAPYQMAGTCSQHFAAAGGPFSPCALACHNEPNQTFPANGKTYSADLYGLARSLGVELRVDVVLSATETSIKDIQSSESFANQVSVGVYQFNADVAPIARGDTASGDALPEATANLNKALSAVDAVDYNQTPSEKVIPYLVNCGATYQFGTVENCAGNTNLVMSMKHLVNGTLPTDAGAQPLTASGSGATPATPEKFMILVTDGMENESASDGATDLASNPNYAGKGVMTNETDNTAVTDTTGKVTPGTCTAIKKLGYTLYVLYVDYLPVSQSQYYLTAINDISQQTLNDFPSTHHLADIADSAKYVNSSDTQATITQDIANNVPTATALSNCASSTSDFKTANSASDIETEINAMLQAALAKTIRLTN